MSKSQTSLDTSLPFIFTIKGKNVFLNSLSLVGIPLECECLDVGKDMLILSTCFDNFCISYVV